MNTEMKVLLLSQYSPFVGGIETRSSTMVKCMDIPFEVVSPLLPDHSKCPHLDFDPDVVYLDYSDMGRFLRDVCDCITIRDIAVIDVQCNVYLGVLGMMLSQKTGKPLIASFHMNLEHPDHAEAEFFAVHPELIRQVIQDSEKVVCVSESVKESLLKFSPVSSTKDIHIIPNGVDLDVFRPQEIKKENALLFVGRFSKEKNIPFLLSLYKRIAETDDCVLWLVGDGPERNSLAQLVETLGISECTTFWGNLCGEELARVYAAASVTVSPSVTEAFGMTTLESIACGTPVLASSNPGTKELMQHLGGGVLFDMHDSKSALAAFHHLTENYDHYRWQGLKNVEKFSWQATLSSLESIYLEYL